MDVINVARGADGRLRQLSGPVAAFRATLDQPDPVLARIATVDATKAGRFVPPAPAASQGVEMPREGARLLGHSEEHQQDLESLMLAWTMGRLRREGREGVHPDAIEAEAHSLMATEEGARLFGAALAESALGASADEPDLLGHRFRFEYLPEGGDPDDAQGLFAISAAEVIMSLDLVPDMVAAHIEGYRLCGRYERLNGAPIDVVFDRQATISQDDVESFGYDCVRASLGLSHHVKGVTIPKLDLGVEPDASPAPGR